jgi:hypothetical protein
MLLFPLYAALVWYGCYRYRRQFLGFAVYIAGVLGLITLAYLDVRLMRWFFNTDASPGLLFLLCAEAGLVALVGGFVVCSPRTRSVIPCRDCGYELSGLDDPNPRCPECGLMHAAVALVPLTCCRCGSVMQGEPQVQAVCDTCRSHPAAAGAA